MLSGLAAIDYLASQSADRANIVTSSHWKKYHSTFEFTGNGFKGLQGFGSHGRASALLSLAGNILQISYKKMGSDISILQKLAKEIMKKQGRRYDLDVLSKL
jgi:hypothetical protein